MKFLYKESDKERRVEFEKADTPHWLWVVLAAFVLIGFITYTIFSHLPVVVEKNEPVIVEEVESITPSKTTSNEDEFEWIKLAISIVFPAIAILCIHNLDRISSNIQSRIDIDDKLLREYTDSIAKKIKESEDYLETLESWERCQ